MYKGEACGYEIQFTNRDYKALLKRWNPKNVEFRRGEFVGFVGNFMGRCPLCYRECRECPLYLDAKYCDGLVVDFLCEKLDCFSEDFGLHMYSITTGLDEEALKAAVGAIYDKLKSFKNVGRKKNG